MKKIACLLLSAAIASSAVPLSAIAENNKYFTDVTGTEYYSAAAETLSELDILNGYDDNTFGADKAVTRAEMAAIICRMLGKDLDLKSDETIFKDVNKDHWAIGYINAAADADIINGYGDGNFMPDDNVKYEEALKMIVCAIGLGDDIEPDPNDWSAPYIKEAEAKKITDNLIGIKGKPASRGDIAVMVYNCLTADLSAPQASKESGTYSAAQSVELYTSTSGAEIYYTTDGTDPTAESIKYSNPISVNKTTTIKAVTILNGVIKSDIKEFEYVIQTSGGSSSSGSSGGSSAAAVKKYTVSFSLNYENSEDIPPIQNIKSGNKIDEPQKPLRDGYIFTGWYIDEDCRELFDFETDIVKNNMTLYAGWEEKNDNDKPDEENPDGNEISVNLTSDSSYIISGKSSTVYFYAEIANNDGSFSSVTLYDSDGNPMMTMADDGMYSENGDELSNDNIYTCKLELNSEDEKQYIFQAVALGNKTVASNKITLNVVDDLTDEEIADMETVDMTIENDLFGIDSYNDMDISDRKTLAKQILDQLEENGLIQEGSITADDENSSFSFIYKSGVLGGVVFKNWNEEQNGGSEESNAAPPQREEVDIVVGEEDTEIDIDDGVIIVPSPVISDTDAIILWSFDQIWDSSSYRRPFYETVSDEWINSGINASVDWDPTVDEYKKLDDYEIIVLSGHGLYYTYTDTASSETKNIASIILHEESSVSKDDMYSIDLKLMNIGKISVQGGTMYTILPDFWRYYYNDGQLDETFVFAENCELEGKGDMVDNNMSSAITKSSAEAVVCFYNTVMADYSRNFMKCYINSLINGYTAGEAFEAAKNEYGETDYFDGREFYGDTAYPVFSGDTEALLSNENLLNMSFESYPDLTGWEYTGDTRVISKLGELLPTDGSRMAILTTGIGSGTSDYINATEGSVIYQTFEVPVGGAVISFDYDVVSEEPWEYVGSKFDDKFLAEIIDADENNILIAEESVNKSEWLDVSGINFDGGDNTAYHTGWKNISYDLSDYAGQTITLKFTVYDVGDSKYDTAALIDNISLD